MNLLSHPFNLYNFSDNLNFKIPKRLNISQIKFTPIPQPRSTTVPNQRTKPRSPEYKRVPPQRDPCHMSTVTHSHLKPQQRVLYRSTVLPFLSCDPCDTHTHTWRAQRRTMQYPVQQRCNAMGDSSVVIVISVLVNLFQHGIVSGVLL